MGAFCYRRVHCFKICLRIQTLLEFRYKTKHEKKKKKETLKPQK